MKKIQEMSKNELTEYCINRKIEGVSFSEIVNILDKSGSDSDTRKTIIKKLEEIDKIQKEALEKFEKTNKKKKGIISSLIGIGIIILGFILYASTAKVGVIFIFNFVVWGVGVVLILRGLLNIIASTIKN